MSNDGNRKKEGTNKKRKQKQRKKEKKKGKKEEMQIDSLTCLWPGLQ